MRLTSNDLTEKLTEAELLNFLFDFACDNQYAVAAWKLPDINTHQVLLSRKVIRSKVDQLEESPSGFLFAPFDREQDPVFLAADYLFTFDQGTLAPAKSPLESTSHAWLHEKINQIAATSRRRFYTREVDIRSHTQNHFLNAVTKGVASIDSGYFEKVVPSRNKIVPLPSHFDLVESFSRLCKVYPNAFVSVVSSPETGTWIGATPEELVRIIDKTIFKTVALAGTQPYNEGANLRKVSWTQKEIEEQALVERYIISCFKKIRLREYEEHGPKTVVAGNLIHLRSDFTVNMRETNFPLLGSTMLKLLHPTSAVCGMPLDAALDFLKNYEGYDRTFYAGYLGPVNVNNQIDLFVNLRCLQVTAESLIAYAGAGVTIDSNPEQEWEETEMKMNTLLSIIY